MEFIVAGDFHTDALALKYVVDQYGSNPAYQIILLGDFFDSFTHQGDVKQMAATLSELGRQPLPNLQLVIGNHDDYFIHVIKRDDFYLQSWLAVGGQYTLRQLGYQQSVHQVSNVAAFLEHLYPDLLQFLASGVYIYDTPNLLAVHAGLDWSLSDPLQTDPDYATWVRDEYFYEPNHFAHPNTLGKTIVSGHTPVQTLTNQWSADPVFLVNNNIQGDVPRWLIDGGSNSGAPSGRVNIVHFSETGQFIRTEFI